MSKKISKERNFEKLSTFWHTTKLYLEKKYNKYDDNYMPSIITDNGVYRYHGKYFFYRLHIITSILTIPSTVSSTLSYNLEKLHIKVDEAITSSFQYF